jgi:WD40 repeat protein
MRSIALLTTFVILGCAPGGPTASTGSGAGGHQSYGPPYSDYFTVARQEFPLEGAALSPDGSLLATYEAPTLRLWNTETAKELRALKPATKGISRMTFSPDGKKLATADTDGNIAIYDTSRWEPVVGRHDCFLLDLEFSPDSRTLLVTVVFPRGFVFLWDVASAKVRKPIRAFEELTGCTAHFSPDGKQLVCRDNARVRFIDIATDKVIHEWTYSLKDGSKGWAVSPDSRTVAIGNLLLDWKTGKVVATMAVPTGDTINSMAFSSNGNILAFSGSENSIKLWDATSFKERLTLTGHTSPIGTIAFSRSGQYLMSHGLDKVKLWRGVPSNP